LPGCAERAERSPVLPPEKGVDPVLVLLTRDPVAQGPVLAYDGSIFFSHGRNVRVVSPNGRHRLWTVEPAPRGHRILPDNTHLICDAKRGAIVRFDDLARRLQVIASKTRGDQVSAPSELVLDQWNGFYFSDSGQAGEPPGSLHYVTPGRVVRKVASDLASPTGLALSADWSALYVVESGKNRVIRFAVLEQGHLGLMSVFATLPGSETPASADAGGLCFDSFGNLYVAYLKMREVLVLDAEGQPLRRYQFDNPTSGVCFGGPYLDQLFVTVAEPGALMRLNLGVKGLDLRPER